ncbi:thiolase family protein [Pseudonocardia pini]|uniref:thiolase family protein n=1 Tax=Pseudonocardia pini TaxID=2758030 RepID=UPI0015EFFF71|nr:thiolase family protein [Pseudonocardia pini]
MATTAVVVDAIRSPMGKGKQGGALSSIHPVELLGQVLRTLMDRNPGVDPGEVDDVIAGCVNQVGQQAGPVGRWGWLAAGLPEHVPSVTVHRACGSSQQAVEFAAQGIIAGVSDVVVACGVESMSRVPLWASFGENQDPYGTQVQERYAPGLIPQGVSADLIAERWKLTREDLDEYAARSHARAATADFGREIVPVTAADGTVVDTDETIRPSTTPETLAGLRTVFDTEEYRTRYPDLTWRITAGNSSQITDGAAALLLMSEERAAALGLTPRARVHTMAVAADDPITMLTGPIPATEKVLRRSGLGIEDLDHYEVNEAFAPVPLAWQAHFDADPAKLNPRGGAIALGHPLGASGARIMTTMLAALEDTGGRYALQTMCEAGGMANATILERI